MRRFAWSIAAFSLVATALVAAPPAASPNFPPRIDFPSGWRAEGIAVGRGHTFYAGDTATGSIYKGDLRTGEGSVLVPGRVGGSVFGVFADNRDRIFAAGGRNCDAWVYDAATGAVIAHYTLTAPPCFINDVSVTNSGAYFTNTIGLSALFKIPIGPNGELGTTTETIPVPFTGGNGIEATADGKTLVAVSITTGTLYAIDTESNAASEIVLDKPLVRGDGLILQGKTLYYVENLPVGADVAVVELAPDLSSGTVGARLNSADDPIVSPATADRFGQLIYVVRRNVAGGTTYYLTRLEAPNGA
jgi:sugar lactone lactonase YvrE